MSAAIDIGEITEALNDKLDRDAGNPEVLGKERIVSWGMPDYSAGIDVTGYTSSSNQFISPTDGIIFISKNINANIYINNILMSAASSQNYGGDTNCILVPKGTNYYATGTISPANFYPLKGVQNA